MSLLEQLKQQAAQVQEQTQLQTAQLTENITQVSEAIKNAFHYLRELGEQLKVVKPQNPHPYLIFGVAEMRNLALSDCRADYRKTQDGDHFDYVTLGITWSGPGKITAQRGSKTEIKQLEDILWRANIPFEFKETRNPNGQPSGGVFTFANEVRTVAQLNGRHQQGMVNLSIRNLNGFNNYDFDLPAREVTHEYIEELAKAMIGATKTLRIPAGSQRGPQG